jgi:hypothetical protein
MVSGFGKPILSCCVIINILSFSPIYHVDRPPLQLSSDPYTNSNSQHQTELEPDTYSYSSTIVTAFQAGRFIDAASSNIGWATSLDSGATWKNGFLPGTTQFTSGFYTRVSDPSVAYDAAHKTWIISSVAVIGNGSTLASPAIIVNLSTDNGLTWSKPLHVVNGGSTYYDKDWIVCDDTTTSAFYGHCYVEWDNDDKGGLILMSTSTNGGLSWNSTVVVAKITGSVLPTAEIDATGKVYLVWVDCQFEKGCNAKGGGEDAVLYNASQGEDDLVMSTSIDGINWSPVQLIPNDPPGSGIDHIIPGLGVDKHSSGKTTHLALTYYYHATSFF